MKKRLQVAGLLLVFAVSLAACSSSSSGTSTTTTAGAATTTTTTAPATTTTTGQHISITPNTGLTNGQVVQISGTGYPPNEQLGVTECSNAGAQTTAGDCNLGAIKVTTSTAAGTVSYKYQVALGPFGQDNIVCTKAPYCILSVSQAGSANPNAEATGNISFSS
jgi:phage tail sheath protein FI